MVNLSDRAIQGNFESEIVIICKVKRYIHMGIYLCKTT